MLTIESASNGYIVATSSSTKVFKGLPALFAYLLFQLTGRSKDGSGSRYGRVAVYKKSGD